MGAGNGSRTCSRGWRITCAPSCDEDSDMVVISATYSDPGSPDSTSLWMHQDAVFRPGCTVVDIGDDGLGDRWRTMSPATIAPSATGGIPAVVSAAGPDSARWMDRYFIGPQG